MWDRQLRSEKHPQGTDEPKQVNNLACANHIARQTSLQGATSSSPSAMPSSPLMMRHDWNQVESNLGPPRQELARCG
jgi:hypothetical protein